MDMQPYDATASDGLNNHRTLEKIHSCVAAPVPLTPSARLCVTMNQATEAITVGIHCILLNKELFFAGTRIAIFPQSILFYSQVGDASYSVCYL